jgi:hypothetical protein
MFSLSQGARGAIKVIGFYPGGFGPRCEGLEHIRKGSHVRVSGVRKGDVFFADSVVKVARSYGGPNTAPSAPRGPWKETGTVVVYRTGKAKDWLEVVTADGEQVPVTVTSGLMARDCLGKRFEFKGKVGAQGFRHSTEVQAVEDA